MTIIKVSPILAVALLLTSTVTAQEAGTLFPASTETAVIDTCTVKPAKDLRISASEAGKLLELNVKEGSRVEENEEIGRVDDNEPQSQKKVATYRLRQARNKFEDDVDERYARAAAEVAEKELERLKIANEQGVIAFTDVEVERARLDFKRSELAIEKAINDRTLAKDDYYTSAAEYEAAENAIQRRKILAPAKGEVVMLYRQQGEWVNPGDPILQLVQLNILHVEGQLDIEKYDPREVLGCEVTVDVMVGGGRKEQATGRVTWISPMTLHDGRWVRDVRAELTNEWDGRYWRIYPGVDAAMTIHLGTAEVRVSQVEK